MKISVSIYHFSSEFCVSLQTLIRAIKSIDGIYWSLLRQGRVTIATNLIKTLLINLYWIIKYLPFRSVNLEFLAMINHFGPSAPFLYPLNTLENRTVFWCFQGVQKGASGTNWLIYSCYHFYWFFIVFWSIYGMHKALLIFVFVDITIRTTFVNGNGSCPERI